MRWPRRTTRWRRHEDDHASASTRVEPREPAADAIENDGARVAPETVIVYVHLPKCGGTALHEWMSGVLAPGMLSPERNRMPATPSADRRAAIRKHRVFSGHFDVVDLANLPGPQRRFTVLRDPVDRIVSLYDYWRAHDAAHVDAHDLVGPRIAAATTFEQFVREPDLRIVHDLDNTMVRTFAGLIRTADPIADPAAAVSEAVTTLSAFEHVGHVDRLDETVMLLRCAFGLTPDDPRRPERANERGAWTEPYLRNVERTTVSPRAREALEPLVRLDRELIARVGR